MPCLAKRGSTINFTVARTARYSFNTKYHIYRYASQRPNLSHRLTGERHREKGDMHIQKPRKACYYL